MCIGKTDHTTLASIKALEVQGKHYTSDFEKIMNLIVLTTAQIFGYYNN
jgi:hypothetical protein